MSEDGQSGGEQNPHIAGLVTVSFSGVSPDPSHSQVHKIVGNVDEGYCCTDNRLLSWISVDLGGLRRLCPKHYCLKNDGLGDYHSLRNWELQGKEAEDGDWVVLKAHTDDAALASKAFASAGWPLVPRSRSAASYGEARAEADIREGLQGEHGEHVFYRYFRILQTGPNTYGANIITCGGMEFYGELREYSPAASTPVVPAAPPTLVPVDNHVMEDTAMITPTSEEGNGAGLTTMPNE